MEVRTLGRSPARHLASQLNTNDLGGLQLPGQASHDVNGIGTTDTDGAHAETTGVGGVRVGTDKQTTGESVVLEDDLVDDTRAGLPETNVVLGAGRGKEVVDLLVDANGTGQILGATNLGLNQMVTVDGGGVGNRGHAGRHELHDGHLGSGVLASNAVGAQLEVGDTTLNVLTVRVVQVRIQNLLGVAQRAVEAGADNVQVLGHLLVVDEVVGLPDVLGDLYRGEDQWLANAFEITKLRGTKAIESTYLLVKRAVRDSGHGATHREAGESRMAPDGLAQELARGQHCGYVCVWMCVRQTLTKSQNSISGQ